MLSYQALFQPEGDQIVITFPDLGHGATCAVNESEGKEMAADFLETILGEMIRRGEDLPQARYRRGRRYRAITIPCPRV